jgi:hypothetical protein
MTPPAARLHSIEIIIMQHRNRRHKNNCERKNDDSVLKFHVNENRHKERLHQKGEGHPKIYKPINVNERHFSL